MMPFFAADQLEDTATVFLGGSNTVGVSSTVGFRIEYTNWLIGHKSDTTSSLAVGGTDSWYAGIRIADIVAAAPTHIVLEYAINDSVYGGYLQSDRTNGWYTAIEGLIVRLRTAMPDAKIICLSLVGYDDWESAEDLASRAAWAAVCTHHDVTNLRFDQYLTALLGHTPSEAEFNLYHDGPHFTELGHNTIFDMIEAQINGYYPFPGAGWTGDLADYQPYHYDDVADWVHDPIIRVGTDNDGETGAGWSDSGTARQSSTADDTISWTGTFASFGLDITPQAGTVTFAWKIDAGAYANMTHASGAAAIKEIYATTYGVHTLTIKVVSGVIKINRFLAM